MSHIRPTSEIAPLVGLLGDAAVLALLEAYAGIRIQIPHSVSERSSLARAIGVKAARQMAAEFGGNKLSVPLAKRWRTLHLRAAGLSYSEIARRVGCTESAVWRVLDDGGLTQQLSLAI